MVRAWWREPANRALLVAAAVGLALRVAWGVAAARTPLDPFADPAQYLRMAGDLSRGDMPTIGGRHTAFHPPGYPLALAPLLFLLRAVGVGGAPVVAAAVNALFGAASILAAGVLARQWVHPRAARWAAWLVALSPGHIFFTSVAVADTAATAVLLVGLAGATALFRDEHLAVTRRGTALAVALGAVAGYGMLVRSSGAVTLLAPLVVVGAGHRRWRRALRPFVLVLVGATLVLAPWAVRNGIQVGVWTPLSTNNATNLCGGLRDGATGAYDERLETVQDCFAGSPFDDPASLPPEVVPDGWRYGVRDEPSWYARETRQALVWAISHPGEALRLVPTKVLHTMRADDGLDAAQDFGNRPLLGTGWAAFLDGVAQGWHWVVVVASGWAILTRSAARRATLVWSGVLALLALTSLGMGMERYNHPVMLLLAVLAAAVATPRREQRLADVGEQPAGKLEPGELDLDGVPVGSGSGEGAEEAVVDGQDGAVVR